MYVITLCSSTLGFAKSSGAITYGIPTEVNQEGVKEEGRERGKGKERYEGREGVGGAGGVPRLS